jgi:predicted Zn-dependent peptidase
MLVDYRMLSGCNGLSYRAFNAYLESLGIEAAFEVSNGLTTLSFSSSKEHLDTVFQVIHDLFTPCAFDPSKWDLLVHLYRESRQQEMADPDVAFYRYKMKMITQDYPLFQPLDPSLADRERAEQLGAFFLGNPLDFTPVIVGDFEVEEVEALAETYLASLIPCPGEEAFSLSSIPALLPSGRVEEMFAYGSFSYERTVMAFPCESDASPIVVKKMIMKLLSQRLLEALRWQAGGTYGVDVHLIHPFYPDIDEAFIEINFTCQSQDRTRLVDLVFQEIERFKNELCSEEEMQSVKQLLIKAMREEALSNHGWISHIVQALQLHTPFQTFEEEEGAAQNVTAEGVRDTVRRLLSRPDCVILTQQSAALEKAS